jgi:WS/DGAT/MGAT family acyltransferase
LHNQHRLTPAQAAALDLEKRRELPLHAGCVLLFDGVAPPLSELIEHVRARLGRAPAFASTAVEVPLPGARPVWATAAVALEQHVRAAALPGGGGEDELAILAGQLLAERLPRGRPLWEIVLVERLEGERFALIARSHAALAGGDLLEALLEDDTAPTPEPARPGSARLLLDALAERISDPRQTLEHARVLTSRAREELAWRGADPLSLLSPAPPWRLGANPGPDRSIAWVEVGLGGLRRSKDKLGGTLNDVALAAVAGALGGYMRSHGDRTGGVTLRALVPIAQARSGGLMASYVPLPVGIADARRRHAAISGSLDGLRASAGAAGAAALAAEDGFAANARLRLAAALLAREHGFNVAVANVGGPPAPRELLGRRLRTVIPALPLGPRQTLSIALASYAGRLCFGLLADPGAVPDLALLAALLRSSLDELPRRRKGG